MNIDTITKWGIEAISKRFYIGNDFIALHETIWIVTVIWESR